MDLRDKITEEVNLRPPNLGVGSVLTLYVKRLCRDGSEKKSSPDQKEKDACSLFYVDTHCPLKASLAIVSVLIFASWELKP